MFFNLGPFEILVLVMVGLIVFGPDKLPTLAKDAARMIKTLRDMAKGARTQLRDELGPEFGDLDLRSLNPRVALQRAIFDDDDEPQANGYNGAGSNGYGSNGYGSNGSSNGYGSNGYGSNGSSNGYDPIDKPQSRPKPAPLAPGERAPYDADAT